MPQNFPDIWLKRVIHHLDSTDRAPFLEGIAELGVETTVINEGKASEMNKIYVAETDFEVDVLLNNNTYPIEAQQLTDGTIEITLDKYQTKVTTVSDDEIIGASYDKIDTVTRSHTHAIGSNKYRRAIHSIAPVQKSDKTPVLKIAGANLTYEDLVAFKRLCDNAEFGDGEVRLVLCPNHWNDLLLDRKNFGDQLVNYRKGQPAPEIAGFKLYKYSGMPIFDSTQNKRAFGEVSVDGDLVSSVAFVPEGVAKKTGLTKQYFKAASTDPDYQTNRLNYRHYFIATPYQRRRIGAILGPK